MNEPSAASTGDAVHQACLYGSDEEFLAMAVPFVDGGIAAGEPVLVTTTAANLDLLGHALADRANRLDYAETGYYGRRPHQRVASFHDYWRRNAEAVPDQGHVRILAEPVWAGRSKRDTTAWQRMEAGLNVLLAGTNVWMICPYDTRVASPSILAGARQTHPSLVTAEHVSSSHEYIDPYAFAHARDTEPLPEPPADAATLSFTGDLATLRDFVAEQAAAHGLASSQAAMMVLAVHEAAGYLFEEAAGQATVRIWAQFGAIVADLQQAGQSLENPFLGYRPPTLQPASDDGLWVARQISMHVDTRTSPADCQVRLLLASHADQELMSRTGR